jgi:phosphoribosyl 1,2-cyclic phosphodiesterase
VITFALQSGSSGNSIYVEAAGMGLLFDAGISGRQAERRLAAHGRDIRRVRAVIISHSHSDHTSCAGIYQRKFGLPLYMTGATHRAVRWWAGRLTDVHRYRAGESIDFGPVRVHTIATPHDAAESVAFVVECEGKRLGVLTDLGHPFEALARMLPELDAAYLESNHDVGMLQSGPYPSFLKARVRGASGHLSNDESADLIRRCGSKRPKWIALAHLSEQNNHPDLALETHRALVGNGYPLHLTSREQATPLLQV